MMGPDRGERYTIEELASLYEFEPTLRDVYVEGRADRGLLTWYFLELDLPAIAYPVDDRVEVPGAMTRQLGQDTNARGRAIALAMKLDELLGLDQVAATVVVDADSAWLTGPFPIRRSCLLMTDGPAMEQYALAERPLTKLLRLALHLPSAVTAQEVMNAIGPAMTEVFVARSVLFQLSIRCIDDVARVCTLEVGRSSADIRELIVRSLAGIPTKECPASVDELTVWVSEARSWIGEGIWIGRGHDIAPLVIKYLKLKGPMANREALEVAMRASLEIKDIRDAPLFAALNNRIGG